MSFRYIASLAIMATAVLAKTDLAGCVSSDSVYTPTQGGTPYATRVWYVPGTGEICAALDCGGGRAPPKTTSARSTRAVGSAATSAAASSPNAAVPTGASRELFSLVAGVAIGAALL
ncbi:hypothetical protein CSAL01_07569 [Colletotrichum salicis]|uniref:Siderophore biosynthesis enzyme n=1 Tax=Colletotrichum salicis TaxID=1209931 RepID=A0A135V067_9PEZI|nr:hypothetical protein CSAL01_07569 [Colletotrichum salicis]